jgi:hypothetical protein
MEVSLLRRGQNQRKLENETGKTENRNGKTGIKEE